MLKKLSAIELQLKQHTQMLQALINASNAQGAAADQTDLPDNNSLPLNSLPSVSQLDEVLQDKEKLKALVTSLF